MSTSTKKRPFSAEKLQGEQKAPEEIKREPKARFPNLQVVINPEARKQLRILAAELDVKQQDLIAEAINLLFKHHGKSPIA
jgi:hypothetical protein